MKSTTTTIAILVALHHSAPNVRANNRSLHRSQCPFGFGDGSEWVCRTATATAQVQEGGSPDVESRILTNNNAPSLYRLARGGATSGVKSVTTIDDEDLDRLVDDLIAGLDGVEVAGGDDTAARASGGDVRPPANEEESDDYESDGSEVAHKIGTDELVIVDEDQGAVLEQNKVDGGVTTAQIDNAKEQRNLRSTTEHASSIVRFDDIRPSADIVADRRTTARSSSLSDVSTPTNAYYRFVVRRGPRGHMLASFTLVAVQFVYIYLPILYQSVASILLKLHVYDPRVLYEKDRQRQMRSMYGPQTKQGGGLTSKLFGTSRPQQRQHMKMQKLADEEAANKLKQLYRTMKISNGLGMLSEVKYRYLSVAFRRKHGLGREYRIEKPLTFMGEVVEGNVGTAVPDEFNVISDDEADEDAQGAMQHIIMPSTRTDRSTMRRGMRSRRQPPEIKQKKIHDWVVDAFESHRNPLTKNPRGESCEVKTSSLWKTVDRSAIREAALESVAAEQSITKQRGSRRGAALGSSNSSNNIDQETPDDNRIDDAFETGRGTVSGGYSASKVFQSVMTRVGSNGRIFGAYPNDAPPIEQCAHRRGVTDLARRYGYGNWKGHGDELIKRGNSDDDDDDDSWGGGDLV
ncbi:hypothetical protein ACHAW5_004492 [Stephanodiscus triporus]|uniref:HMG box domain-containing protein n=1 Tax=Stephanodiscus triporus TaxID=2934178 RepID=A0ABD3Q6P0_9STRA